MNVLFIHHHMPGQFGHLAARLASDPGNRVVFIARHQDAPLANVEARFYQPARTARRETHHYLQSFENAVLHGQQVARSCLQLQHEGFRPDITIAHPGWGGSLFVKDAIPSTPLLNYCEFYYRAKGADVGFDPPGEPDIDTICRLRARNAHLLLGLEACDAGVSPTIWQKSLHPADLQSKISVIFDGIDTQQVRPDAAAQFALPDGRRLSPTDEVITYVARNLEPYRGFPTFIRSLPEICRCRPDAQVVIIGGDEVTYGVSRQDGRTWRAAMLEEVPLDLSRIHFLGRIPYGDYVRLLQVSSVHVYLTVPFVLSWSMLEAMAAGCLVVGSATPPVEEVIEDGRNGFLVDFFSPTELAAKVVDLLRRRSSMQSMRQRARETILARYAVEYCLPQQLALIERYARGSGAHRPV